MGALSLLKQEINQTLKSEHDFAKWKLIVSAGLGAAAFGLGERHEHHLVLALLIPFACAYIDLHLSQYQARMLVLAQFIRSFQFQRVSGDDKTLQAYENTVEALRSHKEHFFDLGQFANRTASIVISILAGFLTAVFYLKDAITKELPQQLTYLIVTIIAGIALWMLGIRAINTVWHTNRERLSALKGEMKILANMMRQRYSARDITSITGFLQLQKTFRFPALSNGLFPAAAIKESKNYTRYSYVWVRDNVHIAHAHDALGYTSKAAETLNTLMDFFAKHKNRFDLIIKEPANKFEKMKRPHIRFEGEALEELSEEWSHKQNDALGYFLWMYCKLANEKRLVPSDIHLTMLSLFPQYFQAIKYWEDEDSGHWEETEKISASSIGAVVAGLEEFKKFAESHGNLSSTDLHELIHKGRKALKDILPSECVQMTPAKIRLHDAALLFLIYPLQIIDGPMADQILENTRVYLEGKYGVRRYLGDSYWAPDYKTKLAEDERTKDFSKDLTKRDKLLEEIELEAQWCLFDPIISCIYGMRYLANPNEADFAKQTEYFNRSLAQITTLNQAGVEAFNCPELYYVENDKKGKNAKYVPNDHVPLLWTQANLMLSLWMMKRTCMKADDISNQSILIKKKDS